MVRLVKNILVTVVVVATTATTGVTSDFNLDSLLSVSVGGGEAVARLRDVATIYGAGRTVINGTPGTFEMYLAMPDRLYFEARLGSFSLVQAYDGRQAWTRDHNGMVSELTGFEKRDIVSSVFFQTYSYLFDDRLPGTRTYLGLEERDGELCHKVAFSPLHEDTIYGYYDVVTGRQRFEVRFIDNAEAVTTYSDHRWHEGVLMSFASEATVVSADMTVSMQVDTLIFDAEFDHSIFKRPVSGVDYSFPENTDRVTVPMEMKDGHIYFEASVNGRRLSFMLDSGASTNVFHAPAIEGLDLVSAGEVATKGVAGYEKIRLVQTDSVEVGQLVLRRQIGGTLKLDMVADSWTGALPFGGVIGYDLLARFPTLVDFAAGTLTIFDPDTFEVPAGGYEVPMELTMQIPTIEATLNGIPGRFLLDLGNSLGLILHHNFWQANDLEDRLDDVREAGASVGGVGGHTASRSAYAAQLAFGEVRVNDLRVILSEGSDGLTGSVELAGNIGNMVLSQFRVLFDYRGERVLFFNLWQTTGRTGGDSDGYKR